MLKRSLFALIGLGLMIAGLMSVPAQAETPKNSVAYDCATDTIVVEAYNFYDEAGLFYVDISREQPYVFVTVDGSFRTVGVNEYVVYSVSLADVEFSWSESDDITVYAQIGSNEWVMSVALGVNILACKSPNPTPTPTETTEPTPTPIPTVEPAPTVPVTVEPTPSATPTQPAPQPQAVKGLKVKAKKAKVTATWKSGTATRWQCKTKVVKGVAKVKPKKRTVTSAKCTFKVKVKTKKAKLKVVVIATAGGNKATKTVAIQRH